METQSRREEEGQRPTSVDPRVINAERRGGAEEEEEEEEEEDSAVQCRTLMALHSAEQDIERKIMRKITIIIIVIIINFIYTLFLPIALHGGTNENNTMGHEQREENKLK